MLIIFLYYKKHAKIGIIDTIRIPDVLPDTFTELIPQLYTALIRRQ